MRCRGLSTPTPRKCSWAPYASNLSAQPRANGPIGENVTGHGLIAGGEAICNCACYAADDFTFCRNTAKTTVGVATYAYDPQLRRWEARGLRFFRAGSPGAERQGRGRTSFVAEGVLPRGPGGPMRFYSTYVGDVVADGDGRSAEIVRARTKDRNAYGNIAIIWEMGDW